MDDFLEKCEDGFQGEEDLHHIDHIDVDLKYQLELAGNVPKSEPRKIFDSMPDAKAKKRAAHEKPQRCDLFLLLLEHLHTVQALGIVVLLQEGSTCTLASETATGRDAQDVANMIAADIWCQWASTHLKLACRLGANYLEQLQVLCTRSARTRRFDALGYLKFAQFVAVAIVAGLLWYQRAQGSSILAATDTAAACFFELVRPRLRYCEIIEK